MAKLIFGCGYLGLRVARLWLQAGDEVFAVTRSPERAASLKAEGIQPIVADILELAKFSVPAGLTTVLFSVGYDRASGRPIQEVYANGLSRALAHLAQEPLRLVYISSTGVYGNVSAHANTTGQEVDEETPCHPTRDGGIASLAAERCLAASPLGNKAVVLRLAGIYGPGRIPRAADLQAGRPINAPARGWLNLIHVDDAAQIVLSAEQHAPLPRTYVVSDGQPVQRSDYYTELAKLLQAPTPQFVEPPKNSPAAQRAASDKRINPGRMFAELNPQLRYAGYREGLAAIIDSDRLSLG